jgi:hypothetical protein
VTNQELVNEIDGPEDVMYDGQEDRVVVKPTDQYRINAQKAINDAFVPVTHVGGFIF